jgi:hypothetical protein
MANIAAKSRGTTATTTTTTTATSIKAIVLGIWCAAIVISGTSPAQAQARAVIASPPAFLAPSPSAFDAPAWAAFGNAWTNVTNYSATVTLFEQKGTITQNSIFDFAFRKPSSVTVHYTTGVNAGVTLEWSGGPTVVAHRGSGLMAIFKKSFALHDPMMTTIRGSSIDQLSFAAILAHSVGTPGTISQGSGPMILGIPSEAVTLVPASSASNMGLTHEIVDISAMNALPVRVLGYEGETLVRQVDFSNIKVGH